jgi:hypothetical protein
MPVFHELTESVILQPLPPVPPVVLPDVPDVPPEVVVLPVVPEVVLPVVPDVVLPVVPLVVPPVVEDAPEVTVMLELPLLW